MGLQSARAREGVVLLLALLCILAIEVTAVGLHFITLQELRTSHAVARDLQLRLAAQSAAALTLRGWPGARAAVLPMHERMNVQLPALATASSDGTTSEASIERLDSAVYLVTGSARSPLGEVSRIGALVMTTTADRLAATLPAAIRTGGSVMSQPGSVTGLIESDLEISGLPLIGSLGLRRLVEIARSTDIAQIESDNANSVAYLAGGSAIPSNDSPRVIVVDGDAEMHGGTFNGILVIRGSLTVTAGARINGSVIAVRGPILIEDGTVMYDSAAVLGALHDPRLLGPYRPRGRLWIPVF